MPQLDYHSHSGLIAAGYEYDSSRDKYFNRGNPSWEAEEKATIGRRQGAFPSQTIAEFRAQESEWAAAEWAKVKSLRSAVKNAE